MSPLVKLNWLSINHVHHTYLFFFCKSCMYSVDGHTNFWNYLLILGGNDSAPFLSQLPYDSYFTSEERFTGELTAYTRKQFFEVKWKYKRNGNHQKLSVINPSTTKISSVHIILLAVCHTVLMMLYVVQRIWYWIN